eukprot:gene17912-biopygen12902
MYQFRIHKSTISLFVPRVCDAIFQVLKEEYFKFPTTQDEWLKLANGAEVKWQFPNAFGAADGKHISINHPQSSGAEFYNYKGFFSIVCLALVDFDYKFVFADVGCQGRISDGGVYRNSMLHQMLCNGDMNLPSPRPLPNSNNPAWEPFESDVPVPYVFVADNAFPLGRNCMKPYPDRALEDKKRIFNYRLSRFRLVSENAFGILTNVFRVFSSTMNLHPDNATSVVLAALVLHNLLRTKSSESYTPLGFADAIVDGDVIEGDWRSTASASALRDLPARRHGNNSTKSAETLRDTFADHFYGPGQVPWQWKNLTSSK